MGPFLLRTRGIPEDRWAAFLEPDPEELLREPLPQAEHFLRLVVQARERDQPVFVFGDSDVDGITGTLILLHALHRFGVRTYYGLASRSRARYGVTLTALERAREVGAGLLIGVDLGALTERLAAALQTEPFPVLLVDHHPQWRSLPDCVILVNPRASGDGFPHFSGAGVALKLAIVLAEYGGFPWKDLLPFAAIGSIADIVPPIGENRVLIRGGLDLWNQTPHPALQVLREVFNLPPGPRLTETEILHQVAPLLNSAGRRGIPQLALEFLLAGSEEGAIDRMRKLLLRNEERKRLGEQYFREALLQMDGRLPGHPALFWSASWPPEMVSLLAGQLLAHFHHPVLVFSFLEEEGRYVGSGRSLPGMDLLSSVRAAAPWVEAGGHPEAFGLVVPAERFPEFREAVQQIRVAPKSAITIIDAELRPSDLTPGFWKTIYRLSPYGPLYPAPLFLLRGVRILSVDRVGPSGRHLRLVLQRERRRFSAFYPNRGSEWAHLLGRTCSVVFTPSRELTTHRPSLEIRALRFLA